MANGTVLDSPNATGETPFVPSPAEAIPDHIRGRWWVAHTRPRAEKVLAEHLTRFGVFNYLPLRERTTRSARTGRFSQSMVPVFPGYLFFAGTDDERYRAMTTNRIVSTLDVPNQEQLVMELRHVHTVLVAGQSFARRQQIKVGQWVRIVTGPLMGLEGVVSRRMSRVRVALNVHTLGQSVSVETTDREIEPIDAPAYVGEPGEPRPGDAGPSA